MRLTLLLLPCVLASAALLASCDETATPKAVESEAQEGAQGRPPGLTLISATTLPLGAANRRHAGQPAPALALERADGRTVTIPAIIAANPGRKILVNLWASWCAPCLKELPTLDRLQAAQQGKLLVVPISEDMEGWRVVHKAFTPARYPHLQSLLDSKMAYGTAVKAEGLPLTILYDSHGRELWRVAGGIDWTGAAARKLLAN